MPHIIIRWYVRYSNGDKRYFDTESEANQVLRANKEWFGEYPVNMSWEQEEWFGYIEW